ncbi:MAG: diguanylate cyclase [Cellvibrionaceae bacterium]
MRVIVCLIGGLTAAGALATAGASKLAPVPEAGRVVGKAHFEYLMTPGDIGWDRFEEIHQRQDWQAPEVNSLNMVNRGTLWVKLPLQPPRSHRDWRLEVQWSDFRRIDLVTWDPVRGMGEIQTAGKHIPLGETQTPQKNVVFPIQLPLDTATTLYLRIEDRTFIHLPMMLFTAEAHESYSVKRLIVFSMVIGIMAVMILYNLSLYLAVRDRMYLFYTNVVFSTLLYLLAYNGYGRIVLWEGNEWLETYASSLFAAYAFLSVAYFFRVFLDLRRYGGWVLHANTFYLIGFSLVLVTTLTPLRIFAIALLGPLAISSSFVGFAAAVSVWRRGNASAKYFILAWTAVSVSTALLTLNLMGKLEYYPALEYSQALSFVAEMVLLSLALADRIRRQRIAKEQAQAELLKMQEYANSSLEAQVQLRTRELESAMVDLKNANRELSKLTKVDPLTQVANRRHFDEAGENEVTVARKKGRPLSVVMVDIDHFKAINDAHGHLVGDKCLKLVAKCISQNVGRPADLVARYGGEEFALILPDTDEANAVTLANRIRAAIDNVALIYDGRSIPMTASLGVTGRVPTQGDTLNSLVSEADKAMYQAKENGRNQVAKVSAQ